MRSCMVKGSEVTHADSVFSEKQGRTHDNTLYMYTSASKFFLTLT